eukprot:12433052-Heterocapsa_arctica.AAC.1
MSKKQLTISTIAFVPTSRGKTGLRTYLPAAPSLGQRLCLDGIRQAVADVGPRPSDLTGKEAISALLAKRGYA